MLELTSVEPNPYVNFSEGDTLEGLLGKPVKVFLSARNIALRGHLIGHDANSVVLEDGVGRTLVYKSQVISVTEDTEDRDE